MKKSILLIVIICSLLLVASSCKKKSSGGENQGIVQSLISAENTSNLEPIVVVPAPQSSEKRAEDRETVSDESAETAVKTEEVVTVENVEEPQSVKEEAEVKPESIIMEVIPAEETPVEEERAEVVTPVAVESVTSDETADVVLPSAEEISAPVEAEKAEESKPYSSFTYSYNGYSSDIVIDATKTTLTIPEGVSYDDIKAVAEMALEAYPAEASLVTYSISGNTVTLFYPEQSWDYLYSILPVVEKEAKYVLDLYPLTLSGEKTEDEASSTSVVEENAGDAFTPESEAETEVVSAAPVTEKASLVSSWSIAAYAEPKFNLTGGWASPFVAGFGLRGEAHFNDSWALGFKAQYDLSAYIEVAAYAKWRFAEAGNFSFYALGGLGMTIGVAPNKGQTSFLLVAAVGAEYSISDSFSVFGELTADWSVYKPGFELGASLGVRYTF